MITTTLLATSSGFPGVTSFPPAQLENRQQAEGKNYKVIVPKCYIAWVSIYVLCTTALVAWYVSWTLLTFVPAPPDQQDSFFTEASWCIITPYDDNCVDNDIYWGAYTVPGDTLSDGSPCTYYNDIKPAFTYCNVDSNITIDWCSRIFDIVTENAWSTCEPNPPQWIFSTPSNYSEVGYPWVHEQGYGDWASWTWVYPAIMLIWLIFIVISIAKFPCSLTRSGDGFTIKHCCCSSRVNSQDVALALTVDRYDYCTHRFILRGLRYLSWGSYTAGMQANHQPAVVFISTGCKTSYRMSMDQATYDEFRRDNFGVQQQQGTIAVGANNNYGSIPTAVVIAGTQPVSANPVK